MMMHIIPAKLLQLILLAILVNVEVASVHWPQEYVVLHYPSRKSFSYPQSNQFEKTG